MEESIVYRERLNFALSLLERVTLTLAKFGQSNRAFLVTIEIKHYLSKQNKLFINHQL